MTAEPTTSANGASPTPPAGSTREKTAIPKNPGRRDLGMKATLLFPDRDIVDRFYVPLIYTACRTCYSELEPDEIFRRAVAGEVDPARQQKLIQGVIESGHGSTIEHIVFTFGISGVSRTLSHQLVRHRAGVAFDQQSQRYVTYKGASTMLPASIEDADPAAQGQRPRGVGREGEGGQGRRSGAQGHLTLDPRTRRRARLTIGASLLHPAPSGQILTV